jgi:hypothetical protein
MNFIRTRLTKKKQIATILIAGCILAVLLLASSLQEFQLQPGQPFPVLGENPTGLVLTETEAVPAAAPKNYPLLFAIIALILLLLPLRALISAIAGLTRQQIARAIRLFFLVSSVFLVFIWSFYLLITRFVSKTPLQPELPIPPGILTAPLGLPPGWVLWLTVAAILVPLVLLIVWLWYRSRHSGTENDSILNIVENAARSARLGQDIQEVIQACYLQMRGAVQTELKIERDEYMTPAEFETFLVEKGFPSDAVHELTRLFEMVRYGQKISGTADEQAAMACLNAILEHTRRVGRELA